MTPRVRGIVTLLAGAAFVAVQVALIASGIVTSSSPGGRVVAAGFIVGGALVVKGGIELVCGEPFSVVAREHKQVLQWLAFLALVLIAVGIVIATT